jgi:nucleoid DNA-binding protein
VTVGRGYLVKALQKRGLSRRASTSLINQVFDHMKKALVNGETVELPIGTLQVIKRNRKPERRYRLNRISTTYKYPFTVKLNTKDNHDL